MMGMPPPHPPRLHVLPWRSQQMCRIDFLPASPTLHLCATLDDLHSVKCAASWSKLLLLPLHNQGCKISKHYGRKRLDGHPWAECVSWKENRSFLLNELNEMSPKCWTKWSREREEACSHRATVGSGLRLKVEDPSVVRNHLRGWWEAALGVSLTHSTGAECLVPS